MYLLYKIFLFVFILVNFPLYFIKLKIKKGERLHLKERLGWGLIHPPNKEKSLWIHAVSVGEVLSLQNLITQIKQKHPHWGVYFSTLTQSGMQMAKEKIREADNHFYIPLDFTWVVRKFFNRLQPRLLVLSESEFWPNLLREARKKTRGVLLVNGRISDQSFKRYRRFKFCIQKLLKNIDFFMVQTLQDKERLEKLGLNSKKIRITGNLKAEVNFSSPGKKEVFSLKKELHIPQSKKIILAGSTREGEEEKLIKAFGRALKKRKDLLLIIAPRHLQRVEEVERIVRKFSLRGVKRTEGVSHSQWEIMILDTLGELASFYAFCDVAFVGGSLVPWGGHNLLEPAFYQKPVFFGPHMENFSFLAEKFVQSGAAQIVSTPEELEEMFLMKNPEHLEKMGTQAKETLDSLQGASGQILEIMESFMEAPEKKA